MNSEEYNKNPKICKQCNAVIPYKQRYNIFCSSSCAATFNNTGAKRSEAHKSAISESIKKYNISIGKVAKEKVKRKRIKKLAEPKAKKPSNALPDEKAKFDIESYKKLYPNVVSVVCIYLQANITKPRIILVVKLSNGKYQTRSYHRAIYELYLGRVLDFPNETVDHIDSNPLNNIISNLQLLSLSENAKKLIKMV